MNNELKPYDEKEFSVTQAQMERFGLKDPQQVVELAKEVNKYVKSQQLSTTIQQKQYVLVEGWQFAAGLLGLVGKVIDYKNESSYEEVTYKWQTTWNGQTQNKSHKTKAYKYFATAVFMRQVQTESGQIIESEVSKGFAMCTNEEQKKHTFDEYSILSMAQTRALGKAARMSFAFLIKAAGYEPTPAEEIDPDIENKAETVTIPEEIENEILMFTNQKDLKQWSIKQTEYHNNMAFSKAVRAALSKLPKE